MAPTAEAADLLNNTLGVLSPSQAQTLEAVLERLLPTDATGPGAEEANVLRYIDWSLAGDLSMFVGPYTSAIAAIDATRSKRSVPHSPPSPRASRTAS